MEKVPETEVNALRKEQEELVEKEAVELATSQKGVSSRCSWWTTRWKEKTGDQHGTPHFKFESLKIAKELPQQGYCPGSN